MTCVNYDNDNTYRIWERAIIRPLLQGRSVARCSLRALIEAGGRGADPAALVVLGFMYEHGHHFVKSMLLAALCYKRAAELGDRRGQFNVGIMLKNGNVYGAAPRLLFPTNCDHLAVDYFEQSASQGYIVALTALGECYECGFGVRQDDATAVKYYAKAAEAGDGDGMIHFARFLKEGRGTSCDEQKAEQFLRRACDLGHPLAHYELARILIDRNTGATPAVCDEARVHLEKAAELGQAEAIGYLGEMYTVLYWKAGVRQDLERGLVYLRRAVELQRPRAQYALGVLHDIGAGVRKDEVEAARLWNSAADGGVPEAGVILEKRYAPWRVPFADPGAE